MGVRGEVQPREEVHPRGSGGQFDLLDPVGLDQVGGDLHAEGREDLAGIKGCRHQGWDGTLKGGPLFQRLAAQVAKPGIAAVSKTAGRKAAQVQILPWALLSIGAP